MVSNRFDQQPPPVNIGEIARLAGVSRSTVSYALSGKRPISDRTRQRIQQVIEDRGFQPNASARALAHGRTRTLGLVFPTVSRRYTDMQLDFINSVVDAAAAHDHDILLSRSDGEGDDSFRRLVGERRVDGALLMEIRAPDSRVEPLVRSGFPFVSMGRTENTDTATLSWVDLDFAELTAACVRHLGRLGHRHLALVGRPRELYDAGYVPALRGRTGFLRATSELGLTGEVHHCGDDAASGQAVVARLLGRDPRTTAVVTLNEAALVGLYRGLALAGRSVPGDFSVTGVAAARWAEAVTPMMTGADVPSDLMGRLAVELLLERLDAPAAAPRQHLLTPSLTPRASTGPAPDRN
ncbi:putative transcriptional regulator [Streptomyces himastatinicus ATCC 53653]|uniref:Putative transcriptional regulator n=1 Tax=Streptomyces himastatinicus ATCC 53653 TaxID=457427 RepID=D9WWK7_9ACTN|nr:putative transcriptional regulator [Streptomyces himastatinicus ATCC 53653]